MADSNLRTQPVRIVTLGGGTGLSTLLRGLKEHVARRRQDAGRRPIADLAAVVTVTDDGGSSGRLRREYSILPPGDIRNCMVALSQDEALLGRLFQYRFHAGRGLRGHSFGNLFLTALSHVTGDFIEAVRLSSEVLAIRGRIFPSTAQNVTLEAVLENGQVVAGETRIARSGKRIRRVRLVPRRVQPLPEVLEAIELADLILVGPGSLYTSIIPNLLVSGVAAAIEKSEATCVYIANLMTQPGESQGYSVADHVRAIYQHTRRLVFDWVVINHQPVSPAVVQRYRADGAEPVRADLGELQRLGLRCVFDNLLEEHGVVRHNTERLTRLLLEEFVARQPVG
ncbi:MAG TPA: uridine diphosphate-N-acetylglucosamine-binding protein YvcK [Candidatus Acidoferrales bacterium]|nr:uridine diphosphate-N-acetylglucosamine-binding protein YvcK [Candidatus Acidoferrales bacterium]